MFSRRSEVIGRDGRIAHAKPLFGRAAHDNSQTHSSSCACMTNMQKVRQTQFKAADHLDWQSQISFSTYSRLPRI